MQKALYCVVHWHYVVLSHSFALCQVVLDSYIVLYFLFQNGLVLSGIGRIVFLFYLFVVCFVCLFVCFRTALFYLTSIVLYLFLSFFQNGLVLSKIDRIKKKKLNAFCFSFCLFVCFRTALFYLASLVVFLLSMYDVSTQCIRDSNSVCQPLKELFSLLTFHSKTPRLLGTGNKKKKLREKKIEKK